MGRQSAVVWYRAGGILIMTKIILCCLFYFVIAYSSVFALKHNYDPALLADMQKNPKNYIALGGAGTGLSLYMERNSINVHKYDPPYYIIAFKQVSYNVYPTGKGWAKGAESEIVRYSYDIKNKKMYRENIYYLQNKREKWEYINPQQLSTSGGKSIFTGGEIAFYLAYNICFYNEPKSSYLQEFFKSGSWVDFGQLSK